jgi:hypothetical protein
LSEFEFVVGWWVLLGKGGWCKFEFVVGWWVLLGKGGWCKFECVVGLESFVKVGFTTIQV